MGGLFREPADDDPAFLADVVANVVFNRPLRQVFSYAVPRELAGDIQPGKRVLAPFGKGNRRTTGFCVGLAKANPAATLKVLNAIIDGEPLLSDRMIELTRWIADYYFCGWGQVFDSVLPAAVKQGRGTKWTTYLEPAPHPAADLEKPTTKQQRALDWLIEQGRPASFREISQGVRCGAEVLKALISKGWATTSRQRVFERPPRVTPVVWNMPPELNDRQRQALEPIVGAIRREQHETFLLHGVTGSGKTEVYLRAIEEVTRQNKEAIVLVPEISLTPQTIERFRQRFGSVAVLHSHLSDVDRNWYWRQIAAGDVQVVIGARSALFAPCQRLGLIVLDEEHETTFKQESVPRYHARDVAVERGRIEQAPVILGSATPSFESWHAAQTGRFQLLSLPERVANLQLPAVGIVDLKSEYSGRTGFHALSQPLARAMEDTLSGGGQVILLLNRRGFSTTILCPQCGRIEKCKHCDIALTYHRDLARLMCHSCDEEFSIPHQCVDCGMPEIRYSGIGTQRLEDEIRARFPGRTCQRMDSDTMKSAAHYERTLGDFRQGKTDILLGTQMIAKGLDFPNVRLVGVISADTARNLPDFRAGERTFQLVAQVSGRTGRGEAPGRVVVQTFNPLDPAILAASKHDYPFFARQELPARKEFGYPPFQLLTRVIVRSKDAKQAERWVKELADRARAQIHPGEAVRIQGPAEAPIVRIKDYFRFHFQIHTADSRRRREFLDAAFGNAELPSDVEFLVDVDPISLL